MTDVGVEKPLVLVGAEGDLTHLQQNQMILLKQPHRCKMGKTKM